MLCFLEIFFWKFLPTLKKKVSLRIVFGKKSLFLENFVFLHLRIKSNDLLVSKKVFLHFLPQIWLFSISSGRGWDRFNISFDLLKSCTQIFVLEWISFSRYWWCNNEHFIRSSSLQMFFKRCVLKCFAIFTGRRLCWSLFWPATLLKKLQLMCFVVNIAKFLRTPILKNSCDQLFLKILKFFL